MNRRELEELKHCVDVALTKLTIPSDAKVVLGLVTEIAVWFATSGAGEKQPQAREDADLLLKFRNEQGRHGVTNDERRPGEAAHQILAAVRDAVEPEEPAIDEELRQESERANDNLTRIARLVIQRGASPELVRAAVREYLVQHVALEQRHVQDLLDIPRGRAVPSKVRVARRVGGVG